MDVAAPGRKRGENTRIAENRLRRIIRDEILREGDVVPMDFRSKRVRKTLVPLISDAFIFSGSSGQIAKVLEMQRDEDDLGGGRVLYEQYVKRDGEWVQEPAQVLEKSLAGFNSRYSPYEGTIEHLNKTRSETEEDERHMEQVMADEGFPDYQNRRHDKKSAQYMSAFRKAATTKPSVTRSLSFRDEG